MTKYNKFWVALLMVGVNYVQSKYAINLGVDAAMAATLVNGIGAALVWAIPNGSA